MTLSYADLSYADLISANLRFGNFRSVTSRSAIFISANLGYANLGYASLRHANLRYADLSSANLRYANLRYANLFVFQGPRHTAYFTHDGRLRIGCESLPITKWAESYREIGTAHDYSEKEIEVYGDFIRMCLGVFERESKQIAGGEE